MMDPGVVRSHLIKRVLPFVLTLLVGASLSGALRHRGHYPHRGCHAFEYGGVYEGGKVLVEPAPDREEGRTRLVVDSLPSSSYVVDGSHKRGPEGAVRLNVSLNADGSASPIDIISTSDPRLDGDAIKAVKNIRFTPATVGRRPKALTAIAEYGCSVFWIGHQAMYGCETSLLSVQNAWPIAYAGSL